jgi:hypothetical protein
MSAKAVLNTLTGMKMKSHSKRIQQTLNTMLLTVSMIIGFSLLGCGDASLANKNSEANASETHASEASASETSESSKTAADLSSVPNEPRRKEPVPAKFVKESKRFISYQVHYEFQEEQWNDPEVLSTMRLQFIWVKPGDKSNVSSLWSMRVDGTDLRQVASAELLDTPTAGAIDASFPIVRSPNNRYVAFAVKTCFSCSERRILDLETKEVIVAPMGGNNPDFHWMPDSKSIVFNAEGLMHYNLETRTGKHIRSRFRDDNWGPWHLIDEGKKIIVSLNNKRYTYDFKSGALLNEQEGEFGSMMFGDHLTYDKKYWIDGRKGDSNWAKFDTPNSYLEKAGKTLGTCFASLTYRAPIYRGFNKGLVKVTPQGTKNVLYLLPNPEDGSADNITLYNVQSEDFEPYYLKDQS